MVGGRVGAGVGVWVCVYVCVCVSGCVRVAVGVGGRTASFVSLTVPGAVVVIGRPCTP